MWVENFIKNIIYNMCVRIRKDLIKKKKKKCESVLFICGGGVFDI